MKKNNARLTWGALGAALVIALVLAINSIRPPEVVKAEVVSAQDKVLGLAAQDTQAQAELNAAMAKACTVRKDYGEAKLELAKLTQLKHENAPLPSYCADFQKASPAKAESGSLIPVAKAAIYYEEGKIEIEKRPVHKGSPEQQKIVDYAWKISKDPTFIYLLKAENGTFEINRKSDIVGSNGYRDFGLCQINKGYHPHIVKNPNFGDYKWQLEQCLALYKSGTTFYGLKNVAKASKSFNWI